MPTVTIRTATDADTDALINLKFEMNRAECAAMPDAFQLKGDRDLTRAAAARGVATYRAEITACGGNFLVAEIDSVVTGCVCWWRHMGSARLLSPVRPQAILSGLVVAQACRGAGVARHLMAAVETEVRAAGIGRLVLGVTADTAPAQAFYRAAGYQATELRMIKAL